MDLIETLSVKSWYLSIDVMSHIPFKTVFNSIAMQTHKLSC